MLRQSLERPSENYLKIFKEALINFVNGIRAFLEKNCPKMP